MTAVLRQADRALPLGRRVPRGSVRWYLASCPEGSESATCAKVRAIVPADLLKDAFAPFVEKLEKHGGVPSVRIRSLFPGYFVAATSDAPALQRALSRLSFDVQLAGSVGRGFAPIDADAQAFIAKSMDASHTIRLSEGEIVSDELHVLWGPLVGEEGRVRKIDRHKNAAMVRVCGTGQGFSLVMPLSVPVRR